MQILRRHFSRYTLEVVSEVCGCSRLLLGNMGRPGGGIMALHGYSTIQGATDVSTLYGTLPAYPPQPAVRHPFITKADGLGWLFSLGIKDGPLPAHYEPVESPVGNLLYPKQNNNPTMRFFEGPLNRIVQGPTLDFPVVATTSVSRSIISAGR